MALLKALLLSAGLGVLAACTTLPPLDGRTTSTAMSDTADTRLGQAIAPRVAAHAGQSGVYPLLEGRDAFAARALLARAAERTLDIQYYIWHSDMSGTMLFEAVRAAADRGVRVRLLLDDNNTLGLDATLAALDAHPNIEIRLFNPFVNRRLRAIGYLTDFFRLNRRMHNKSFTADNQATIIGGRNVGDEYFGATNGQAFVDLDLIAVGPIVAEVSADFDRYWASDSSYPLERLVAVAPEHIGQIATAALRVEHDPAAAAYLEVVRDSPFVQELVEGRLPLDWAPTRIVSDDPAKGLELGHAQALLPQFSKIIGKPSRELELVSAYFVPGAAGVDAFVAMAQRGVRVDILTNSLEATDVAPVHAGYAKRRKPLLEGGVRLYELRRLSPQPERKSGPRALLQSSGSSLHAKTFSVDRSHVFVGSFNFDPRSINLNTEMGFIIESPALARKIASAFEIGIRSIAYEVRLDDDKHLYWLEQRDDRTLRHDVEPGTTFWQRAAVWFMSLLPIDWLL